MISSQGRRAYGNQDNNLGSGPSNLLLLLLLVVVVVVLLLLLLLLFINFDN